VMILRKGRLEKSAKRGLGQFIRKMQAKWKDSLNKTFWEKSITLLGDLCFVYQCGRGFFEV
jgi:hypothetical protein